MTPLRPSVAEETIGSASGDALLPIRLSQLLGTRVFEREEEGGNGDDSLARLFDNKDHLIVVVADANL
jgi:hypothetical protein